MDAKITQRFKKMGAGSQQICQLRAATYKMTISVSEGEKAENCWRLGEYFWEVSLWACFSLVLISRHPLLAAFRDRMLG